MPYALTLKALDGADPIADLWREAEPFETNPSMRPLGYPPHLTLAIFASIDTTALVREAVALTAGQPAVELAFDEIRHFDGPPLVLWAAPRETAALVRLHRRVFDRLPVDACHPHYRPGSWIPHCTLAMAVDAGRRSAALDWARSRTLRFTVRFDAVDALRFPPVEVLQASRLLSKTRRQDGRQ